VRKNDVPSHTLLQLLAGLLIVILLTAANAAPALADSVTSAVLDAARVWTTVHVRTILVTGLVVIVCVAPSRGTTLPGSLYPNPKRPKETRHSLNIPFTKGKLAGYYSIRINDQWHIIFQWESGNARNVQVVDYH